MLKKSLHTAFAAATIFTLNSAEPSAFEIRNYEEKIEEKLIREVKFEPADKKLFRAYGGAAAAGIGVDNSCALKLERTDDKQTVYATIGLPQIVPGADYVVEVAVKGENITKSSAKRQFHCLATESRLTATGQMANWRDGTTRCYSDIPGKEFTTLKMDFKGKKGLQPFVVLNIPSGYLGTVCFDNLKVYQKGMPSTLTLTAPALQIFRTDNGKFEVSATAAKVADPLLLAILHRDKKIMRSVIVRPDLDNVFRGDFGKDLEAGEAGLMLIFADAASKEKVGMLEMNCSIESADGE